MGVAHFVAVSSDDHDKKEINARKQKWVDDQPDLAENSVEMLLMKFGPGVFGNERSSFPEHAPIAIKGRQSRFKRLIDLYGGGFVHCERLPYSWALTPRARAKAEKLNIPHPRTYALSAKSMEV